MKPADDSCTVHKDSFDLKDSEFRRIRDLLYAEAGINLSAAKKALVAGRLINRMRHLALNSYGDYFEIMKSDRQGEMQHAINCLTTNETFFFRESRHFDFLRSEVVPTWRSGPKRLWSAASSSGEEAYSLAMLMAEHCPIQAWEIVGTDISTRVLATAQAGQYPMQRAKDIPMRYLRRYCMKGVASQEGTFIIGDALRSKVTFCHANLKQNLSSLGMFDVVFLRNVMIYFDVTTKQQVVAGIARQIRPGGHLIVGHSETLNGVSDAFISVSPSIYRKPW